MTESIIGGLVWLLVLAALGVAAWGLDKVTEITGGVWTIGVACFIGILARILQAQGHHRALMDALAPDEQEEGE